MRMIPIAAAMLLASGCSGGADREDAVPTNSVAITESAAPVGGGAAGAQANLSDARGRAVATLNLTEEAGGVRVRLAATGMPAGTYGAHVHAVGRCDAPGFTTAEGHWNPTGRQHGRENPAGAHLGDLPNLTVGADGSGSVEYVVTGATLAGAENPMLDADGAAMLIHARADDYRTDPSGESGDRIACGVIRAAG